MPFILGVTRDILEAALEKREEPSPQLGSQRSPPGQKRSPGTFERQTSFRRRFQRDGLPNLTVVVEGSNAGGPHSVSPSAEAPARQRSLSDALSIHSETERIEASSPSSMGGRSTESSTLPLEEWMTGGLAERISSQHSRSRNRVATHEVTPKWQSPGHHVSRQWQSDTEGEGVPPRRLVSLPADQTDTDMASFSEHEGASVDDTAGVPRESAMDNDRDGDGIHNIILIDLDSGQLGSLSSSWWKRTPQSKANVQWKDRIKDLPKALTSCAESPEAATLLSQIFGLHQKHAETIAGLRKLQKTSAARKSVALQGLSPSPEACIALSKETNAVIRTWLALCFRGLLDFSVACPDPRSFQPVTQTQPVPCNLPARCTALRVASSFMQSRKDDASRALLQGILATQSSLEMFDNWLYRISEATCGPFLRELYGEHWATIGSTCAAGARWAAGLPQGASTLLCVLNSIHPTLLPCLPSLPYQDASTCSSLHVETVRVIPSEEKNEEPPFPSLHIPSLAPREVAPPPPPKHRRSLTTTGTGPSLLSLDISSKKLSHLSVETNSAEKKEAQEEPEKPQVLGLQTHQAILDFELLLLYSVGASGFQLSTGESKLKPSLPLAEWPSGAQFSFSVAAFSHTAEQEEKEGGVTHEGVSEAEYESDSPFDGLAQSTDESAKFQVALEQTTRWFGQSWGRELFVNFLITQIPSLFRHGAMPEEAQYLFSKKHMRTREGANLLQAACSACLEAALAESVDNSLLGSTAEHSPEVEQLQPPADSRSKGRVLLSVNLMQCCLHFLVPMRQPVVSSPTSLHSADYTALSCLVGRDQPFLSSHSIWEAAFMDILNELMEVRQRTQQRGQGIGTTKWFLPLLSFLHTIALQSFKAATAASLGSFAAQLLAIPADALPSWSDQLSGSSHHPMPFSPSQVPLVTAATSVSQSQSRRGSDSRLHNLDMVPMVLEAVNISLLCS